MSSEEQRIWSQVKNLYKEKFGMPPRLVDYLASSEFIFLCAKGLSVDTIARRFSFGRDYISFCIKEFLNFEGWEHDLDFSPIDFYFRYNNFDEYKKEVLIFSIEDEKSVNKSYNVSRRFCELERKLEKYGYTRF